MKLNVADSRAPSETVAETPRLILRRTVVGDAPFLLGLLNQPSWLQFIGDKNVRTLADAEAYVRNGPMAMVKKHGFGLNVIELKAGGAAVGLCGLVKRDTLPDPDLGFALLESEFGKGYALEAAAATMQHAQDVLGIRRVLAITTPTNDRSGRLLEKLGFRSQGTVRPNPAGEELKLYVFGR